MPSSNHTADKIPSLRQHKYWHSRGYLPHCDVPGLLQSLTFRLADALPAEALAHIQLARDDKKNTASPKPF